LSASAEILVIFSVLYFFVIGLVGLCCKPQPLVIVIITITVTYCLAPGSDDKLINVGTRYCRNGKLQPTWSVTIICWWRRWNLLSHWRAALLVRACHSGQFPG